MFKLSPAGEEIVKKELTRYESKRSAIIPALYQVQKEMGWVSSDAIQYLSGLMDLPQAWIQEVMMFYTMFNQHPVGKHHVQVCTNVSCAMNGGRELADHICKSFDAQYGEVTKDGKFTVSRVECLGSCGTAPMMQVGDAYYENLTPEKAVELLRKMD